MKLGVIAVSTRKNRVGEPVATWAYEVAKEHGGFDSVEFIDLREVNLPVFSEPHHPATGKYESEDAQNWSKIIAPLDAVVFVTPEYDFFAPSSLVNAINYLSLEWAYKPAAFVSYGGLSGGMRSVQAAKPLLTTAKMMPIPEQVAFQFVWESIDENGQLQPADVHTGSGTAMLDELARWSTALKTLRN